MYAFMMGKLKGGACVLRSFHEGERVRAARLLGAGERRFAKEFGVLTVELPERLPTEYVNVLAVEVEGR